MPTVCDALERGCGGRRRHRPNGLRRRPDRSRSQIRTFNVAPTWTRLINSNTVLTVGAFVRHDQYNYYPSDDPFADLGPPTFNGKPSRQHRSLTNAGARASLPT